MANALRTEWYHRALPPALVAALESALAAVLAQQRPMPDLGARVQQGQAPSVQELAFGFHPLLVTRSHSLLATLYQVSGDPGRADAHAQAAERTAGDDVSMAIALAIRANLHMNRTGETSMADVWLERGLVHARRSGDARALVLILRLQAAAAANLRNDYARAEPLARECLQLQQTLHDPLQICYRQGDLAACWLYTGRAEAAAALMENALLECRRQEPSVAQA